MIYSGILSQIDADTPKYYRRIDFLAYWISFFTMTHLGGDDTSEVRTRDFLRLLSQHDRSVYAMILAMVHNWADADEIAQELRLRLWEQFDNYLPDKDFGKWARTVAYNLILTHRKKSKKTSQAFGTVFIEALADKVADSTDSSGDDDVRQIALAKCLELLAEKNRSLIQQYYASRDSLGEIALRLGRSYEATRKAVYRTQMALADCIEDRLRRGRQT
jgi:RNA polymerase sigma-70 factor, ECF subfamily